MQLWDLYEIIILAIRVGAIELKYVVHT